MIFHELAQALDKKVQALLSMGLVFRVYSS